MKRHYNGKKGNYTVSDMANESQQSLRETHEEKMARWRREEQRDREQLIHAGIATAEQLKELDEEFTPETVNAAIHCWLKTWIARGKGYESLRRGVKYAAMYT